MRFKKNVEKEVREFLLERLDKYKGEMQMTESERQALYKWVSEGHDPYTCGCDWYNENGTEMDFVNSLRMDDAQMEQMESMTEEERADYLGWNQIKSGSLELESVTNLPWLSGETV